MRNRRWIVVLCLMLFIGPVFADEPPPAEDAKPPPLMGCPGGLERFLPGDYYFCRAALHMSSGYPQMTRESLLDAARWGSKSAQYALGVMYFNGDLAKMNRPLGLAWLALAAERHTPKYEGTFVSAYGKATKEERAQADAYWNEMKPIYSDAVAAARAKLRFNREFARIKGSDNVYIDGVGDRSTFGLSQQLQAEQARFFAGYESHVYVGDLTLVPVNEALRMQQDAAQEKSPQPN